MYPFFFYEKGYAILVTLQKSVVIKYGKSPFVDGKVIYERDHKKEKERD